MNPKFIKVTLNSFIITMNIFYTNLARKFGIIDITHDVSFCIPHFDFANETWWLTGLYNLAKQGHALFD